MIAASSAVLRQVAPVLPAAAQRHAAAECLLFALLSVTCRCPPSRRFLCALPPAQRQAWAEAWATLVKPGGQLVTLIFPVDPEKPRDSGPPFPVTPELYADLLEPAGGCS